MAYIYNVDTNVVVKAPQFPLNNKAKKVINKENKENTGTSPHITGQLVSTLTLTSQLKRLVKPIPTINDLYI